MVKYKTLSEERPDLLKEWDYEKNNELGIYPDKISYGSHKKVWWKCSKGHSYECSIYNKIRGRGCSICAGKKVLVGFNDLESLKPDLVKEWDYEKNNELGIYPDKVTCGSHKKVWWKCSKGHSWFAIISSRAITGRGCPKCYAYSQTSFPEQAVYYFLDMFFHDEIKNRFKLKDEKGYIEADIYLSKQNIVIEYDGMYWHKYKHEKDLEKEFRFKRLGILFIRIKEYNCNKVIDNCILYNCYKNRDENLTWAIQELFVMLNISSLFVNVLAFRDKILEFTRTNEIKNNLAEISPELAKEWNYEKNGDLNPVYFKPNSNFIVWWKCDKGHEWKDGINQRNHGRGCPYCSHHRVINGENDLMTLYPEIIKYWDYEKNGNQLPSNFLPESGIKVWWKCLKCGYGWNSTIQKRVLCKKRSGHFCPVCSGHKVLAGYNDLGTLFPKLIKEWDFNKNDLSPFEIRPGSGKKVWWKCSICGYKWQATIYERSYSNTGCPKCALIKRGKKRSLPKRDNSFQDKFPELIKEWNYEKNGDLLPSHVSYGSNKKVWWKCSVCGHEWQARIVNRSYGYGCPECAKAKRRKKKG